MLPPKLRLLFQIIHCNYLSLTSPYCLTFQLLWNTDYFITVGCKGCEVQSVLCGKLLLDVKKIQKPPLMPASFIVTKNAWSNKMYGLCEYTHTAHTSDIGKSQSWMPRRCHGWLFCIPLCCYIWLSEDQTSYCSVLGASQHSQTVFTEAFWNI